MAADFLDDPECAICNFNAEADASRQTSGICHLPRCAVNAHAPPFPDGGGGATVEATGGLSPSPIQAAAPPPLRSDSHGSPQGSSGSPRSPALGQSAPPLWSPSKKRSRRLFGKCGISLQTMRVRVEARKSSPRIRLPIGPAGTRPFVVPIGVRRAKGASGRGDGGITQSGEPCGVTSWPQSSLRIGAPVAASSPRAVTAAGSDASTMRPQTRFQPGC
jgi:hypothetical protein